MNVATTFERSARQFPDKAALRCADEELTYGELDEQASALAAFLRGNGFGGGERLAIYLPNCLEYMVCMLAAWKAGGVALPINYMFTEDVLRYVLDDSGSSWLAVGQEDARRLEAVIRDCGLADSLLVTGGRPETGYAFDEVASGEAEGLRAAAKRDGEDAVLMYTSGTTGRPKGVRQSHRNNLAAMEMIADAWRLTPEDHWLLAAPMFHVGGLQVSTFPMLSCGGTVTMLPRWSAAEWLELAAEHRPTLSGLIAAMVVDVANYAPEETFRLDSLRLCLIGGSRVPEPAIQRFKQRFGVGLKEVYGQTETTGLCTTYLAEEERIPGSVGRAMGQVVEARVTHPDTGEEIPPTDPTTGELHLRGEIITPGYWNRPEVTAEKFDGQWLRTGDMVRRDERGYIYYADRADDMIVSGGENVYPQEVEGAISEHEGVAEVSVIGTPHERWVEQVTAIVVPTDESLTTEDIEEFCAAHASLSRYQRPGRIVLVESLPKMGSGKIDRATLKREYAPSPAT